MVEECRETRIHGRLGWKAMPFALEDLDSYERSISGVACNGQRGILTNLVSMFGEDCMLG